MRWEQPVQFASQSDIGFRRRNNQDACIVQVSSEQEAWNQHGHLFIVADGMGGHAVGELASKIAVDQIPHTYFKTKDTPIPEALQAAIEGANAAIYDRGMSNHDFKRMGTTCVALVLSPEGAISGHVGDSRLYRVRKNRIEQLTFDHSLHWELLRQGKLKPDEILLRETRHVITRSLGPEATVDVDIEGPYPINPGDTFVLCSDGLTGHLSDTEIGVIARELPPPDACRLLVNLANLRGGSDNITVIVARVGDVPGAVANDNGQSQGSGWWWLAAIWAIAMAFVGGVSLTLLGNRVPGVSLVGVAVAGALGLVLKKWWGSSRSRRSASPEVADASKPYRVAKAKLNAEFLNQLAAIESKLQQTAMDEGWTLDWTEHETAYNAAKAAIAENKLSRAMSGFAKTIDVLMLGFQLQRKKRDHDAKWSKTPQTPNKDS